MEQNGKKMSILKSIGYALGLIWQADRKTVLINFYKESTERIFGAFFAVYLMKYIFECIEKGVDFHKLVQVIAAFCAAHIIVHINSAYMDYRNRKMNPVIYQHVFQKVMKKAESIELTRYEQPEFYNKFSRTLDNCLDGMMDGMCNSALTVAWLLAYLTGLGIMATVDLKLPVITFTASIGAFWFGLKTNEYYMKLREEETPPQRVLNYVKRVAYEKKYAGELRLYPVGKLLFRRFDEKNEERFGIYKKLYRKIAFCRVMESVVFMDGAYLGVFFYMDYVIKVKNVKMLGAYIAMASSMGFISYGLKKSVECFDNAGKKFGYMRYLKEFLDYQPMQTDQGKRIPEDVLGDIAFSDVSFTYEGSTKPVIDNLNLSINKGEKIALVGENGAGKTTLMKLLMGLYPVTSGQITINQIPVQEYEGDSYRERIGAVFQDFQIFALPLSENVLMRQPVSEKERMLVKDSLEKAQFLDVLKKLPDGIDTILTKEFSKDGFICSGGQAQKIAIARVFAKNPDIVILDEPSSALDPIAEFNMYQNMLEASSGKTVFFISHRMSSARIADRIFYMEQGRVVESGTHEELISLDGRYAKMFRMQASNYQDKTGGQEDAE